MAEVWHITHDANDWSEYDSGVPPGGSKVALSAASALGGSAYGLAVDVTAAGISFIYKDLSSISNSATVVRFGFRLDLNGIVLNTSSAESLFEIIPAAGQNFCDLIWLRENGSGGFNIEIETIDDDTTIRQQNSATLPSGDITIEVVWEKPASTSSNDGTCTIYVNGAISGTPITTLDNFDNFEYLTGSPSPDNNLILDLGSNGGGSDSGTLYIDEFIVRDDDTQIYPPPGGALTLAAMTKPADIDASGEFIYVALLEGGTPILTKISTALDTDGTTVFNPGAGDNIGVECGRFDADVVWVAGNFDGTNVVEKSEDGGSNFTVKDDGGIGDVRAFVMGPDSDNKILVFDETNGDILETRDNGGSWTTINASVTPEVNAIARLGENVQESVFGNDGGANNSIDYSINSGDDLEDFQTGVYPNANATRVIAN